MKIIPLHPAPKRLPQKTLVERLIEKYQQTGDHLRLRFLGNNPAYAGGDWIA